MSLIDWEGAKFDRGYQFFDGINNAVFPGLGKRISRAFFLYNVENIVNNYE